MAGRMAGHMLRENLSLIAGQITEFGRRNSASIKRSFLLVLYMNPRVVNKPNNAVGNIQIQKIKEVKYRPGATVFVTKALVKLVIYGMSPQSLGVCICVARRYLYM